MTADQSNPDALDLSTIWEDEPDYEDSAGRPASGAAGGDPPESRLSVVYGPADAPFARTDASERVVDRVERLEQALEELVERLGHSARDRGFLGEDGLADRFASLEERFREASRSFAARLQTLSQDLDRQQGRHAALAKETHAMREAVLPDVEELRRAASVSVAEAAEELREELTRRMTYLEESLTEGLRAYERSVDSRLDGLRRAMDRGVR